MIVAVDPGGTTGVACSSSDGGFFHSLEFTDWRDAVQHAEGAHPIHEIVVERYTITPSTLKKTAQYDALYAIGALTYVAHLRDIPLVLQTPAVAKQMATNARLKYMGWRRPTSGGHADDAARHLLALLMRRRWVDVEEIIRATRT